MSFTLANKSPVTIILDGKPIKIPRARRAFFRDWASELDGKALAAATDGMDDKERARWAAVYRITPTTNYDLIRYMETPEGSDRIIGHCMEQGGVDPAVIEEVLEDLGPRQRSELAMVLASVVDDSALAARSGQKQEESNGNGEGSEDPLAKRTTPALAP